MLRGVLSAMEAARRNGVSEQSVHSWKRLFLEADREDLGKGARRPSWREMELEAENEELQAALGEAHVQLRVWKKGAEYLPLRGPRDDPPRRTAHGLEFAELVGMSWRTCHYRHAKLRAGEPVKGPWPAPVVETT